jgi:hypothetical protein
MKSSPRRTACRRPHNASEDTVTIGASRRGERAKSRRDDVQPVEDRRERDDVIRQAANAVTEALVHLLTITAANAPAAIAPLVRSPFDARQTRRLVEAGTLAAVKVGRDWYGRPADFEALIPQKKTLTTAQADPITTGADRILQEELGRRGLRLRETAAPAPRLDAPRAAGRELAPGPTRPRALPPARRTG